MPRVCNIRKLKNKSAQIKKEKLYALFACIIKYFETPRRLIMPCTYNLHSIVSVVPAVKILITILMHYPRHYCEFNFIEFQKLYEKLLLQVYKYDQTTNNKCSNYLSNKRNVYKLPIQVK